MAALLEDKVAIVTGAGRGVGRAHALALAAAGAKVVVNDLGTAGDGSGTTTGPATDVCGEIHARGGQAVPSFGDIADEDDARSLVAQAIDAFGRLDVLVCNAGIIHGKAMIDLSVEEWDRLQRINLRGHFLPSREAARYWSGRHAAGDAVAASIVLTGSRAGLVGSPGQLDYAASKAAIAAMTIAMARELAPVGVRVNAVCPRASTRMTADAAGYAAAAPAGGFDRTAAENNSPMVAYLASDRAAGVTGQVFVVGEDDVHWAEGWRVRRSLRSPGAALTPEQIDAHAHLLFGDEPTGVPPGIAGLLPEVESVVPAAGR